MLQFFLSPKVWNDKMCGLVWLITVTLLVIYPAHRDTKRDAKITTLWQYKFFLLSMFTMTAVSGWGLIGPIWEQFPLRLLNFVKGLIYQLLEIESLRWNTYYGKTYLLYLLTN